MAFTILQSTQKPSFDLNDTEMNCLLKKNKFLKNFTWDEIKDTDSGTEIGQQLREYQESFLNYDLSNKTNATSIGFEFLNDDVLIFDDFRLQEVSYDIESHTIRNLLKEFPDKVDEEVLENSDFALDVNAEEVEDFFLSQYRDDIAEYLLEGMELEYLSIDAEEYPEYDKLLDDNMNELVGMIPNWINLNKNEEDFRDYDNASDLAQWFFDDAMLNFDFLVTFDDKKKLVDEMFNDFFDKDEIINEYFDDIVVNTFLVTDYSGDEIDFGKEVDSFLDSLDEDDKLEWMENSFKPLDFVNQIMSGDWLFYDYALDYLEDWKYGFLRDIRTRINNLSDKIVTQKGELSSSDEVRDFAEDLIIDNFWDIKDDSMSADDLWEEIIKNYEIYDSTEGYQASINKETENLSHFTKSQVSQVLDELTQETYVKCAENAPAEWADLIKSPKFVADVKVGSEHIFDPQSFADEVYQAIVEGKYDGELKTFIRKNTTLEQEVTKSWLKASQTTIDNAEDNGKDIFYATLQSMPEVGEKASDFPTKPFDFAKAFYGVLDYEKIVSERM